MSAWEAVPRAAPVNIAEPEHGTVLITPVASAEEVEAEVQRKKRATSCWARPPAKETALTAVRRMLPLQWHTRSMDTWQAAYFSFYDLGIALGPVSRLKEPPRSSITSVPPSALQLLYGSVASALGAFVAGGLVAPPKPGAEPGRLEEVAMRWRLVTDVSQRVVRETADKHDLWRIVGQAAWRSALLLRGLMQAGQLPDELILHIAQVSVLSTFAAPPPPPPRPAVPPADSVCRVPATTVCMRCGGGGNVMPTPRQPLVPTQQLRDRAAGAWPVAAANAAANAAIAPSREAMRKTRIAASGSSTPRAPPDEGYEGCDDENTPGDASSRKRPRVRRKEASATRRL